MFNSHGALWHIVCRRCNVVTFVLKGLRGCKINSTWADVNSSLPSNPPLLIWSMGRSLLSRRRFLAASSYRHVSYWLQIGSVYCTNRADARTSDRPSNCKEIKNFSLTNYSLIAKISKIWKFCLTTLVQLYRPVYFVFERARALSRRFLLEHFKGTKAMFRGPGGNGLCFLFSPIKYCSRLQDHHHDRHLMQS